MKKEEFLGFTEKFDGDVAYITLTNDVETFEGECAVSELVEKGIHERRGFKCWFTEDGEWHVEPIPRPGINDAEIDAWLDEIFKE